MNTHVRKYIVVPLLKEFEDTKEVVKIRILKNKQHNGQKKK